MRHGFAGDFIPYDAKAERERPLKPQGVAMAKAVAKAMGDSGEIPDAVLTSPYTRTTQTADIIGSYFGTQVSVIGDLAPNRPIDARIIEMMSHGQVKKLMLVGHVDNTTPCFRNFQNVDGYKWKDLVMAECRRVKIDRKSGDWSLRWCVKPSDLGLKDIAK